MLWYKSWLETRWRFVTGLALLALSAAGTVLAYPQVERLLPLAGNAADAGGELGRRIREGMELARSYRGYVWSQGFRQNLPQMGTLFAVLLGTGGLWSPSASGSLFTLSLPVSRTRVLGIRAATGLAEWLAVALVPALVFVLFSPGVGQSYSAADAAAHGLCLFAAGSTFYSLAFLLSTSFADLWRPLLIACAVAVCLAVADIVFRGLAPYSIYGVMTAETYFRTGRLPWPGLAVSAALSATMLYAASINIARRDF